jgi:GWxTD domain-containing protein
MKQRISYIKQLLLLLAATVLLASCGGGSAFSRPDVGYLYDFKSLAPRPHYVVHHRAVDTTRVYYRLNSEDLLYQRAVNEEEYKADFTISYKLLKSFETPEVLDSAVFALTDTEQNPQGKILFGYFDVAPVNGFDTGSFVLDIKIIDNHRSLSFSNFVSIDRNSKQSAQHFLLCDTNETPIFKHHLPLQVPFKLKTSGKAGRLFVSYYNRNFPYALPPYATPADETFELSPDTTFAIEADSTLSLTQEGYYFFRQDTSIWQGFTLYSFYPQFPYIANNQLMVGPMRYITTKREYDALVAAKGDPQKLQAEINDFWLNRTGTAERSKQLLSAYYHRVEEANLLFSSFLEGWKTDRGILYIIYGAPDKVFRFSESEIWIYGEENSSLSYSFTFSKLNNPFSDNDYQLIRNGSYRYGWGQAIEAWRNGKVYTSKDIQQEQNESDQRTRAQQRAPYWY